MAISDDILDETVKHSVYLERYKRSVIRDILKLLRKTEDGVIKSVVRKELQDMKAVLQRSKNSYISSLKTEMLSQKAGYLIND